MSLQIGRVGIDVAGSDPLTWKEQGNVTTVTGEHFAGTTANAQVLRQQLLGYVGNEYEKYVPVIWSADATRTGFYRVLDATVDTDAALLTAGKVPYTVKLERVRGYSYPLAECVLLGANRQNTNGFMTPTPFHVVPATWTGWDYGFVAVLAPKTRNISGSVPMSYYESASLYKASVLVSAAPADWYTGAATIRTGSPLNVVTGYQIVNTPMNWEISTGMVRVTNSSGGADHFQVEWINTAGSAWSAKQGVTLGWAGFSALPSGTTPSSVTVLRNSPEECSLRLTYPVYTGQSSRLILDLTLRRGSRYVSGFLSSNNTQAWGIQFTNTPALTNSFYTGVSVRETAANGSGNQNVMVTATLPSTADVNAGAGHSALYSNGVTTAFDFMVGSVVGAGSAVAPDRWSDLELQFYAALSELQTVVAS